MLASSLVCVDLPLPVVRPCLIIMAAKTDRLAQPIKEDLVSFIPYNILRLYVIIKEFEVSNYVLNYVLKVQKQENTSVLTKAIFLVLLQHYR